MCECLGLTVAHDVLHDTVELSLARVRSLRAGSRCTVPMHFVCAAIEEVLGSGALTDESGGALVKALRDVALHTGRSSSQRDCLAWVQTITCACSSSVSVPYTRRAACTITARSRVRG